MATARQLQKQATADSVGEEANIFTETGWFQLSATRLPSEADLITLRSKVGSAGALDPPHHWEQLLTDRTVTEQYELQPGTEEHDSVVRSFMATLDDKVVQVLRVERVQNLPMWQSYVVKRQSICDRDKQDKKTNNLTGEQHQSKALKRFERSWLWHGSSGEVVKKITQQGFNRSFCGKNATLYGKGVYFAQDASYSARREYAVPDVNGWQYMLACRVVVGEFCKGENNALTPAVRDAYSQALYDTTVDDTVCPSIYVTYHDAQAYPEVRMLCVGFLSTCFEFRSGTLTLCLPCRMLSSSI